MNFENIGSPIALIVNSDKKKPNKVLFIEHDKTKVHHQFENYKCQSGEKIQQLPNVAIERTIVYTSGASGSGKSYYIKDFADQYKKLYPKREIYLFSPLTDDAGSIDKIKGLKKIKINEAQFKADEIPAEMFKDSLVIFDDAEAISDKNLRKKVLGIQNSILTTGRHHNTSIAVSSHTACNGGETKLILSEAHSVTIFPSGLGGRSLKYLLDSYFGLSKHQIKKLKGMDGRWVTLIKSYPMCVISENEAYTLNPKTDD
jgi:hypothetical protein